MLYREIEKTGDMISILGFGCMRLPEKNGRIDKNSATEQIHYAIDHGVNYIDTALPYHMGASEPFLGHALLDGYREKVKLATKLPPWSVKGKDDMINIFNLQLKNLKTDCIDYYMLHGLNHSSWEKMNKLDALDFLDKQKAEGKILYTGFSFHGGKNIFKEIVDAYKWDFCQIQYNYLDENRQAGKEGLEYAARKGLGVMIMEPLRGGNLTANIPAEVMEIWNQAKIKRTPAEWALRWIWNHPEVTTVLSGMNKLEQVEENIRIANEARPNSLTPEELELYKRIREKYFQLTKTGCTGCRYCMPCPAGVDIPNCFEIYDGEYTFGSKKQAMIDYAFSLGVSREGDAYASKCKKCGRCEKLCPQELPIMDLLDNISRDIEGFNFKIFSKVVKLFASFQRIRSKF